MIPKQTFTVIAIYHNVLMYAECIQNANIKSELDIIAYIRLVSHTCASTQLHESHYESNLRKCLEHFVHINYMIWSLSNSSLFPFGNNVAKV